jgi:hypothetical protein
MMTDWKPDLIPSSAGANTRVHAATQRVVNEAFAAEKPHLKTLQLPNDFLGPRSAR